MDGVPDKSFMNNHYTHPEYPNGVVNFINFVIAHKGDREYFPCPCSRCKNNDAYQRKIVEIYHHCGHFGLDPTYTVWDKHGEVSAQNAMISQRRQWLEGRSHAGPSVNPPLQILQDVFPYYPGYHEGASHDYVEENYRVQFNDLVDDDYDKFERLLRESQTPLYPGSEQTVLGAILELMELKVENRWSDTSIDKLCKWVHKSFEKHDFPPTYARIKRIISDLSLGYEKIHVCEFNCYLFRGMDNKNVKFCPVCGAARYKPNTDDIPKKVIWYFPITKRLKRLFMSPHTAKHMRWHKEKRQDESILRHPSDGESWQHFNRTFPGFDDQKGRNVRIGLATDGFSPFGTMSTQHSTWPVVVMPLNLPPNMCMRKEYNILAVLIPGPKSPGKCLSVLIQPLIDELKDLWENGVPNFDRVDNDVFVMKVALVLTISDFPGLGMLAGSTVKGYKTCPICLDELTAEHICGRIVYDGHRKWLDEDDPMRSML